MPGGRGQGWEPRDSCLGHVVPLSVPWTFNSSDSGHPPKPGGQCEAQSTVWLSLGFSFPRWPNGVSVTLFRLGSFLFLLLQH